jgi:hypothetical protein
MSYYPILNAPQCKGWTTLCNFSPNNWEVSNNSEKYVNVTWADEGSWHTRNIGKIASNEFRQVNIEEVENYIPKLALPLLSITSSTMPELSSTLPKSESPTEVPAWRAALGLSTNFTLTSYQGEIDPFPSPGSLLTFCPFLQFDKDISNFLIFMNIEKTPILRKSYIEIYNPANPKVLLERFEVSNNSATAISLDSLDFSQEDLPLIICKDMSGIPLYLSKLNDGSFMSLEHTHPPASFVIHGNRWGAQKALKSKWFSRVPQS